MTSKTFKSAFEDSSYRLEVCKNAGAEHASLWILGCGSASTSIAIADKDAPALALAILEAAGVVPVQRDYESYDDGTPAHLQAVAYFLKQHNEARERATAEARERAELEAEALELFKASGAYGSDRLFLKFSDLEETTQSAWLAVARRARELAKEATK